MLDPLPQPVLMMKPIPSEEAAPPAKPLVFKEAGGASGDDSAGGGGGAKDGEATDKTDEELARALHEQLNA